MMSRQWLRKNFKFVQRNQTSCPSCVGRNWTHSFWLMLPASNLSEHRCDKVSLTSLTLQTVIIEIYEAWELGNRLLHLPFLLSLKYSLESFIRAEERGYKSALKVDEMMIGLLVENKRKLSMLRMDEISLDNTLIVLGCSPGTDSRLHHNTSSK